MIPPDTATSAVAVQSEVLRKLDINARAHMTFQLSDNLRQTVEAGLRHRHPDWDRQKIKRELLRLTIGEDLFQQAFGEKQPLL